MNTYLNNIMNSKIKFCRFVSYQAEDEYGAEDEYEYEKSGHWCRLLFEGRCFARGTSRVPQSNVCIKFQEEEK